MGRAARFPAGMPFLAAALAVATVAQDAWPQNAKDLARARERFKEAAALQAAGDFSRALEAYKDVARVKSTAQVRFNIATCEEKLGDYLSAAGTYRLALTEATKSNAKEMEAAVQGALAELEPRIPTLLLRRGDGAAVAEVTLDGLRVAATSFGTAFPINPGPHDLRANAPDRLPLVLEISIADREHRSVTLVLKPRPVAAPLAPVSSRAEEPPPPPPPAPRGRALLYAGIGVGAAGVASLAVSAAFFAQRQSAIATLDAACGPTKMTCPAIDASTRDSGARDATIATATFIAGLGALAIGGTLMIVSTRTKAPVPAAALTVTPGGAALQGTF